MAEPASRLALMDTVVTEDNREKDFLSSKFNERYAFTKFTTHRVGVEEVGRPDLISYREYGSVEWWWLIMKVNGLIDPFELVPAEVIVIPDLSEYLEFFRKYKSNNA